MPAMSRLRPRIIGRAVQRERDQVSKANNETRGWKVVAGSGFGIAFGSAVFVTSSFGLLGAAASSQLGWAQADVAKAASLFLTLQMLTFPVVGWVLDKFGSRRVATASIALFSSGLAILSQSFGALWHFYFAFLFIGLVSGGTNVIAYVRAITHWFERRRGLALGCAAAFQSVGLLLVPALFATLLDAIGLGAAVLALAALEALFVLPIVALLVRDGPDQRADGTSGALGEATIAEDATKPAGAAAWRTPTFWKIACTLFVMGASFYGVIANVGFILEKSAGLTLRQIAQVQMIFGAGVLIGRAFFGYMLDKASAATVGISSIILAVMFFVGYGVGGSSLLISCAAFLGGMSIGGESDLGPYLAGRYFGVQNVSKVFGWFLSSFFLGGAVGTFSFAMMQSAYGIATPLFGLAALQIVPIFLLLRLASYPRSPVRS